MKHLLLGLTVSLVLFSTSCTDTLEPVDISYNYDYFPLKIGQYAIYTADSVVYDLTANGVTIDSSNYEVKLEIVDSTALGEFVVHYSERQHSGEAWQLKQVYTSQRSKDKAEWVENNRRFVKLVFPLQKGTSWNGNRYFDATETIEIAGETIEMFKNWSSEATVLDSTETIGGLNFDAVATVQQADVENLIERRFLVEKYGKNVGLVYREAMILDTQCGGNLANCEGKTWEEKAEKGFIVRWVIKAFGD